MFKKISKKVEFFIIGQRKYQTLFWKWITLLRLFHSQEQFAMAHSYFEKIKFLKQKFMSFFDKKLIFYKEMGIFNPFLPNSELWLAGMVHMSTPRTIWHWGFGKYYLKSSQLKRFSHKTITRSGGSKKPLFFVWGRRME